MNAIETRFNNILEVQPDEEDIRAINSINKTADIDRGITLDEMDQLRTKLEYSGKISIRVPKTLHRDLAQGAKDEGISLNQFILYKLAK